MAYTKILRPIKKTLSRSIDYITNPEKTDNGVLISYFGVEGKDTAAKEFQEIYNLNENDRKENLARHIVQSFAPGEVDPIQAHQIGLDFCQKFLNGEYQYVLATHNDTDHIHNHIILNNVRMTDFKCYNITKDHELISKISDEICKEYSLSIIEKNKDKPIKGHKSYYENMCLKAGKSWKEKTKYAIDLCINEASDLNEFTELMGALNFEVDNIKSGKYLKIKHISQERFIRCSEKNFGEGYTREDIIKKIKEKNLLLSKTKNINPLILDKSIANEKIKNLEGEIEISILNSNNLNEFHSSLEDKDIKFDTLNKKINFRDEKSFLQVPENKLNKKFRYDAIIDSFINKKEKKDFYKKEFIPYKDINGLKYAIDTSIKKSSSISEFILNMEKLGYKIEENKNEFCFDKSGFLKKITCRSEILGTHYTYYGIFERIKNKDNKLEFENPGRIINEKYKSSFENNLKTITQNLIILNKYGMNTFEDITERIAIYNENIDRNNINILKIKNEIKEISSSNISDLDKEKLIADKKQMITDLYNEQKFLKNDLKVLKKIKENGDKFLGKNEKKYSKNEYNL